MKITESKLRKIIRKVIAETNKNGSLEPSHPDYESVAEVISMVRRDLMFGHIGKDEVQKSCELYAGDYEVYHHLDYIVEKVMSSISAMGL